FKFCEVNEALQIERECDGSLLITSPTSWQTGRRNAKLTTQLTNWAERDGTGEVADSSGGSFLPNRAMRGPDAVWVSHERLSAVPERELRTVPHLVPDFVVELRSPSNRLRRLQAKMEEYLANGVRLGWLLDPTTRTAYVYRPGTPVEVLQD